MLTELARQQISIKGVRRRIEIAAERHKTAKVEARLVAEIEAAKPGPSIKSKNWFHISEIVGEKASTISEVQQAVCRHFGIQLIDLRKHRHLRTVVRPRQIAMYLCRERTTRSQPEIGRMFGGYDHTTVLHAYRVISGLVKLDWEIAYDVAHIEGLLA